MEQDFNTTNWTNPCPKYDCRKDKCVCGLEMVRIPASLGDDSEDSKVAPYNGAYCNSLVIYEANDHVYIYTKEGIPTLIDVDASDISTLEQEVIKAQRDIAEFREDIDRFAYFFDTVAEMKASDQLQAGDYARTLGYRSINDGGGALYKISNTGTANEMDVIAVGIALNANLVPAQTMTTRQFGCIADGVSNDTTHLQRALDFCKNRVHQLNFIGTEFYIDQSLNLENYKGLTMNFYARLHRKSQPSTTFGFRLAECSDIVFNNLDLYSERDQTEPAPQDHSRISSLGSNIVGVMMYYSSNLEFNNSKFENTAADFMNQRYNGTNVRSENICINGWYSRNSSGPLFMQYVNNVIICNADIIPAENMGAGDHFVYFSKCVDRVYIENSKFVNTDGNYGPAIQFHSTGSDLPEDAPKNLIVTGCKIKTCAAFITIRLDTNATIMDTDIEFISTRQHTGCIVKNDAKLTIDGCRIHGNLSDSFYESSTSGSCDITIQCCDVDITADNVDAFLALSSDSTPKISLLNNHIKWDSALLFSNTTVTPEVFIKDNIIVQDNSTSALLSARKNAGIVNFNNNIVFNEGTYPRLIYNGGISSNHCFVYSNQISGFTALANSTEIASIHNDYNAFIT